MRSLFLVPLVFLLGCSPKDSIVFHAFSKDGLYEYMFVHRGDENYQGMVKYAGETAFRSHIVVPSNEFETAIDRTPEAVRSGALITEPADKHTSFRIVDGGVYVRRPGQTGMMSWMAMDLAKADSVLGPRLALFDVTD